MQTYYETERLILKVLTPEYCHSVLRFYYRNQTFFRPYDPVYPPGYFTPVYQKIGLVYEYKSYLSGKSVRYYIFRKDSPHSIIGTVSFTNILYDMQKKATVGYKFDHQHQHHGYATESLQKGIEIMFSELGIHRLEAFIMPSNEPSRRLIKRLGFTYEGIALENLLIQNQWTDHEQYSLLSHTISVHQ